MVSRAKIPDRKEKIMTCTKLKVYRCNESARLPEKSTRGSAGYDLRACLVDGTKVKTYNPWNKEVDVPVKKMIWPGNSTIQVHPGYRVAVPTGLVFDSDPDHVLKIFSRSGLALKSGLMVVNGVGVVDSDYVEEAFVLLYNTSDGPITITHGDRIAQAVLERNTYSEIEEISEKPAQKTERNGGLGSTGA
jgi:dUTP pyrophosphatase